MNFQPVLEDEIIIAQPLKADDFEALFKVASDPKIWDQHPNKNRYQRDVFKTFFEGALASGGALLVIDKKSEEIAGCSRFYDWDETKKSILIGYTFFAKKFWGRGYNLRLKNLMLHHAFQFAQTVIFHIGATNFRSQKSITKLGAVKTGEQEIKYYGEAPKLNFIYSIEKESFQRPSSGIL